MARGFGVAGALDPAIVREIAPAVEARGYQTFWANDTPQGDGLAALAEAARVTSRIRLGVGVIPLDRQPAERIARRVRELRLPHDRLTLGIGSGGRRQGALDLVRAGAGELLAQTRAVVVVAALGLRMCSLAGEVSDGVLLNWLTPLFAERSGGVVRAAAREAGRPAPRIDGYVRVALGPAATRRLEAEAARYTTYPQYAAHFRRMGVDAMGTSVAGETPEQIQAGLAPFDTVLDETVVRAIVAEETAAAYLALVEAAANGQ